MSTVWNHSCFVRLGVRITDFKPRLTTADVSPPVRGMESFSEDAGFEGLGYDVVPFNCTVVMNNYMQADTAKITMPYDKLSLSPLILDQVQVQIYGGVLTQEEIENRAALGGSGLMKGLLVPPTIDPKTGNSNEMFRGFAPSHRVKKSRDGADIVELNCVDLTAIFTSAEMYEDPLKDIPKTAKIDEVIRLMLYGDGIPVKDASRRFGLPGARGTVIVNETGGDLPALQDIHPPEYFDSKGTAKKARSSGSKKKIKFWDAITDLCKSAGFFCYIRSGRRAIGGVIPGAELVITTPRTFYVAQDAQMSSTPGIRKFIDGLNIDEYTIEKQYTGDAQPTAIEVRSYDPTIRKTRFAKYPKKSLVNRMGGDDKGKGDREEISVKVVSPMSGPGVVDVLCRMAISLYDHQAREGLEVSFSSETTMSALQEPPSQNPDGSMDPDQADMFWMRPGDTFEMFSAPPKPDEGLVSSRILFDDMTQGARVAEYIERGLPESLATKAALADGDPFVQAFFRTTKITWTWTYAESGTGQEGGWAWECQGNSYQDSRSAPDVLTDTCLTGIARA